MFEQAVLSNGPASKRVWTTFAGVTGQALLVTVAVMIPMIWPEAMPGRQALLRVFIPAPPPPLPHRGEAAPPRVTRVIREFPKNGISIPRYVPPHPVQIIDEPPMPQGVYSGADTGPAVGSPYGVASGLITDILGSARLTPMPPRPAMVHHDEAPAAPAPSIPRYKEGGNVHLGKLIHRVEPLYPRLAAMAHIEGVVELRGVVGIDGRIRELHLLHGHPLLAGAAIEAVKQWIYEPTTLNGDKVEIDAPIRVTFRLN